MNKLIFSLILILFTQPLLAGDNPESILSNLQRKYDKIRDASVIFTQNVRFGVTKTEQTFKGTLFMKKGNKYRIEIEDQTIVTDGQSVWSYAAGTNQVLIDKYREDPKSFSPDKILVNVPRQYSSTIIGTEKLGKIETTILKLIPKDQNANLKWLKVWVDEDEWIMKKIQVMDVSDNLTTYGVESLKTNMDLNDTLFQFSPPAGAEVIDSR